MTPACPDCNYDLSGEAATWDAAGRCPLVGTCPECGVHGPWRRMFDHDSWRLPGFVEHARGLRERILWSWRTALWALWPWNFWSRVKPRHRVRPRGWVWWILAGIWLPRALAGVTSLLFFSLLLGLTPPAISSRFSVLKWLLVLAGVPVNEIALARGDVLEAFLSPWPTPLRWIALECLAWPLAVTLAPRFGRRRGLAPALLARTIVFSLVPFALLSLWQVLIILSSGLTGLIWDPRTTTFHPFWTVLNITTTIHHWGAWLGVPWVALWWLAALSHGFKPKRARELWLILAIIIHVVLIFLFGPRVDPLAW